MGRSGASTIDNNTRARETMVGEAGGRGERAGQDIPGDVHRRTRTGASRAGPTSRAGPGRVCRARGEREAPAPPQDARRCADGGQVSTSSGGVLSARAQGHRLGNVFVARHRRRVVRPSGGRRKRRWGSRGRIQMRPPTRFRCRLCGTSLKAWRAVPQLVNGAACGIMSRSIMQRRCGRPSK
jgi:hypothetical protein